MQSLKKYLLVFACAAFALVSCNTEEVKPSQASTPTTHVKNRISEGTIPYGHTENVSANNGTITRSYEVDATNTSRVWLRLNNFSESIACGTAPGVTPDCPKLTVKDGQGTTVYTTSSLFGNKYVKVTGTKFSITVYNPSWISSSSDVDFEVLSW